MQRMKIYADTFVLGGCFDAEFSKYSNLLVSEFAKGKKLLMLSDITLGELQRAPDCIRDIIRAIPDRYVVPVELNDDAELLARTYIKEKAIVKKFYNDALHIAIATIYGADVLVSWNFKHIVNIARIRLYNSVNYKYGYRPIEIRTPMEVVDEK